MTEFTVLFVLYPNFTQLDFAGPYEVFCRLPNTRVRIASPDGGDLRTEHGLTYSGLERLSEIESCDLLCIPGGLDQSRMTDPAVQADIRRLAASARYVTSVCNGSNILGWCGLLEGKRSACHWSQLAGLAKFGALPDKARVVRDGNFISGGGVTAGIDFALTCAAEIAGEPTAQMIQLLIEYSPKPPFNAGHPETAPPEIMAALLERFAARAARTSSG